MSANLKAKLRRQFSTQLHDELTNVPCEPVTERRRGQRVEIDTLVAAVKKDGSRFEGYTRNISGRGTAAIVWGELNVGDYLRIGPSAAPKRQSFPPS